MGTTTLEAYLVAVIIRHDVVDAYFAKHIIRHPRWSVPFLADSVMIPVHWLSQARRKRSLMPLIVIIFGDEPWLGVSKMLAPSRETVKI
jgi:hypothetical protein